MVVETAPQGTGSGYPLRFDVAYPERLSRWLIFVKWLFAIPAFVIYLIASLIIYLPIGAFLTILFRKKYPRWWFDAIVEFLGFQQRLFSYFMLLRDEYPALDEPQSVTLEVDYPENLNRWLPMVKWILVIPHIIVLYVVQIIATLLIFVAWFAILFTGTFPRGLFNFVVVYFRWNLRVSAYAFLLLTDKYPPFSLD